MIKEDVRLLATAIATLLAIVLLMGYIVVADRVSTGAFDSFDEAALLSLRTEGDRSNPLGPSWLEEIMRDATALGGAMVAMLLTVSGVVMLALTRKPFLACYVAGAVGTGLLMCLFLKSSYDRPRPDLAPHGSHVYTRSFPSGHTMVASTVYLTLGVMVARLQRRRAAKYYILAAVIAVTVLVGFSRVYLAVHWPSDVLAGWLLGAGWAVLSWCVAALISHRFKSAEAPSVRRVAKELADKAR